VRRERDGDQRGAEAGDAEYQRAEKRDSREEEDLGGFGQALRQSFTLGSASSDR
jgi:hypothetical protein